MAQSAIWNLYVMEYARSKDQPWVDLVAGMYAEGVMDLPVLLRSVAARRPQRPGRHRFHARRARSGFLRKIRHPDLDLAAPSARGDEPRPRRHLRHLHHARPFRPYGLDRRISQSAHLHPEERAALLVRALRAAEALQPSHRDRRSRTPCARRSARRSSTASPCSTATRTMCCPAFTCGSAAGTRSATRS